jgi:predicted GNAT family acetyltransferase
MDTPVEHERASARFVARIPEGVAQLRYRMASPSVMDIESTYVPAAARGRGVAAALVAQALEYARTRGFEVIPSCWYVQTWVDRHPEFEPLLRR